MNRGKARQTIFHGEIYYQAFLQTLDEAHKRFDACIHAYCLMSNHYHLLIETPRANLDRIMRHINGIYTQRYNLRRTDGPLFRGRYKAIIVDADDYLLPLSRYIHRNPIEVKGVTADKLDTYSWSSYHAYINQAKAPEWLYREATYSALGAKQRYVAYKTYVGRGIDEDISRFYNKGNVATILGDKSFKTYIAENRESMHISGDLSRIVTDKPKGAAIVDAVAAVFGVNASDVLTRQRGRQRANLPRKVAIYCCQQLGDMPLKTLVDIFGYSRVSSLSPATDYVKSGLSDGSLKGVFEQVCNRLKNIKYD